MVHSEAKKDFDVVDCAWYFTYWLLTKKPNDPCNRPSSWKIYIHEDKVLWSIEKTFYIFMTITPHVGCMHHRLKMLYLNRHLVQIILLITIYFCHCAIFYVTNGLTLKSNIDLFCFLEFRIFSRRINSFKIIDYNGNYLIK